MILLALTIAWAARLDELARFGRHAKEFKVKQRTCERPGLCCDASTKLCLVVKGISRSYASFTRSVPPMSFLSNSKSACRQVFPPSNVGHEGSLWSHDHYLWNLVWIPRISDHYKLSIWLPLVRSVVTYTEIDRTLLNFSGLISSR